MDGDAGRGRRSGGRRKAARVLLAVTRAAVNLTAVVARAAVVAELAVVAALGKAAAAAGHAMTAVRDAVARRRNPAPLLRRYLEFVSGRRRPSTLRAVPST